MDEAHWRRLRAVLEDLLRLAPGERRDELRRIRAEDEALASEVLELLRLDIEGAVPMEPPAGQGLPWLRDPAAGLPDDP